MQLGRSLKASSRSSCCCHGEEQVDIGTQGLTRSKPFPAPDLCSAFAFYSFAPPGLKAPSTAWYALSAHVKSLLGLSWQPAARSWGKGPGDAGCCGQWGTRGTGHKAPSQPVLQTPHKSIKPVAVPAACSSPVHKGEVAVPASSHPARHGVMPLQLLGDLSPPL